MGCYEYVQAFGSGRSNSDGFPNQLSPQQCLQCLLSVEKSRAWRAAPSPGPCPGALTCSAASNAHALATRILCFCPGFIAKPLSNDTGAGYRAEGSVQMGRFVAKVALCPSQGQASFWYYHEVMGLAILSFAVPSLL